MARSITGVDHLVILVEDLDSARDRFARLGFTVSPRGLHSDFLGTANHTIMLQGDYFELLGIRMPTEQNAPWRERLAAGEGISSIALQTTNAQTAHDELSEAGIGMKAPIEFVRPVDLPGGGTGEAAFAVALLDEPGTPLDGLFAVEHRTRDTVWIPELLDHANTAMALGAVEAIAADLDAVAAAYRGLFGPDAVTARGEQLTIDSGSIPITVSAADGAGPFAVTGMTVRIADPDAAEAALAEAGVASNRSGGALRVAPASACSVALTLLAD